MFSLYDHIGPALGPDPKTTNFTIEIERLMDFINLHSVFYNIYRSREEEFPRCNPFLLNGHIGPAL